MEKYYNKETPWDKMNLGNVIRAGGKSKKLYTQHNMNEFRMQHSVSNEEWAKIATTIIIFVRHWGVIITNSFICSIIFQHFTNGIVFQHYNDRTGGSSLIKSTTRNALYTNTNYFPVRSNVKRGTFSAQTVQVHRSVWSAWPQFGQQHCPAAALVLAA
jgi:hypothetical protein